MEAEPSPGPSPSSLNFPFQQGDFSSFGDLFSQSQSPNLLNHNLNAYSQHPSPSAPTSALSPGQNFADLLAEFTLPGTALSPAAANGENSAGTTTEGQEPYDGQGEYSNAPSPQHQNGQSGPVGGGQLSEDVNLQFQQFIAASLANSTGGVPTPTPQQYTSQPLYHSQNPSHQSSPVSSLPQSLPPSHAPSPMPAYSGPNPSNPIYQQQPLHQTPCVIVPNPYSIGPPQYSIPTQQAALFAQQFAMLQSQGQQQMANVLAQAQAIVQANQIAQHHQQQQQFSVGSQSTTGDGEWRENEFLFSPLMSPAMTPGSAFTVASSLPPSTGPLPLSAPSDFFPPLTSPALGPQMYSTDHQGQHLLSHRNSLQGLVDGVGALSTQLPPGSPHTFPYQSPRMHPHDAGSNTAAGSGRRGASSSSKKARPSPLIKASDPALDPNRRKRRTTASNGYKSATTSPYIGASNPSISSKNGSTPGTFSASSSTGGASQRTSPAEFAIDTPSPVDLASSSFSIKNGGIAVDGLPIPPPSFSSSHSNTQMYQLEPMGPPPPPSHSQSHSFPSSQPQQQLSTSSNSSTSSSFNPITPATIMNFSSDFDISTLSSLSPALGPISDGPGSAFGSVQNSPILLPQQPESNGLPFAMNGTRQEDETFDVPTISSSVGKAKSSRKSTGSVKASPALRAVDAKGKGKASATNGEVGRKAGSASSKQAKIAPSAKVAQSPKIKPSNVVTDTLPEPQSRKKNDLEPDLPGGGPVVTTDNRKSTHKLAEQKRRDSLKLCFDELRKLLPPIMPFIDDGNRRPGEGNVGGQRNGEMDPENPNKGVSKVALLRRSNEYLDILRERIERRDRAITALRRQNEELKAKQKELGGTPDERDEDVEEGEEDEFEIPGLDLDLDNIDGGEKAAGNLAFYEDLDFETKFATLPVARRASTSSSRRGSITSAAPTPKPTTRRSTRNTASHNTSNEAMDVEA